MEDKDASHEQKSIIYKSFTVPDIYRVSLAADSPAWPQPARPRLRATRAYSRLLARSSGLRIPTHEAKSGRNSALSSYPLTNFHTIQTR